jgi:hypothetical protein
MDREKLKRDIIESPLNKIETDMLVRRLAVASSEGCAAVVRDFDVAMAQYRQKTLASHRLRRGFVGSAFKSFQTKQGFCLNTK